MLIAITMHGKAINKQKEHVRYRRQTMQKEREMCYKTLYYRRISTSMKGKCNIIIESIAIAYREIS